MKLSKWLAAAVFSLVFQASASAQIYESEDAEGVPDFSDTPTAGSQVIDLPTTNVMDAPPEITEPPAETRAPASAPASAMERAPAAMESEEGDSGVVYYGGDDEDDERARHRLNEKRVEKALPGAGEAHEVHREVHREGGVHQGGGGRR